MKSFLSEARPTKLKYSLQTHLFSNDAYWIWKIALHMYLYNVCSKYGDGNCCYFQKAKLGRYILSTPACNYIQKLTVTYT